MLMSFRTKCGVAKICDVFGKLQLHAPALVSRVFARGSENFYSLEHKLYQTIYSPINAHNGKNVELLKQFKIKEAAPICFGLQGNHHQGTTAST